MSQKPCVAQSPQNVPWALTSDRLEEFCRQLGLRPVPISGHYFSDLAQEIGMVELMVPPELAAGRQDGDGGTFSH